MIYSTDPEDIKKLIQLEKETAQDIEDQYIIFKNNVSEWLKIVRSEILSHGAVTIVAYIDDTYINGTKAIFRDSVTSSNSFSAISRRLKVSEYSMNVVDSLPQRFEEVFDEVSNSNTEFDTSYDGSANLSTENIDKFKDISNNYKNALNNIYDMKMQELAVLMEEYLLAQSMYSILGSQIKIMINSVNCVDRFYEAMLEWYKEALRSNSETINELNEKAKNVAHKIADVVKFVANIIGQIFNNKLGLNNSEVSSSPEKPVPQSSIESENDDESSNDNSSLETSGDQLNNLISNQREAMLKELIENILRDLNTPESIQNVKSLITDGFSTIDKMKKRLENCDDDIKGKLVNHAGAELKKMIGNNGPALMKMASLVVLKFLPNDPIAAMIVSGLSGMVDWTNNDGSTVDDINKAEFSFDAAKAAIPKGENIEDPSMLEQYLDKNKDKIQDHILSALIDNPEYSKALGIKQSELNDSPTVQDFRRSRGEKVLDYPKSYSPISYAISNKDPYGNGSAALDPELKVTIELIDDTISKINASPEFAELSQSKLNDGIDLVAKSFGDDNGYVSISPNSEVGKLVNGLHDSISKNKMPNLLDNIDGRYNKAEMTSFFSELDNTKKADGSFDVPKATQNFLRSQCGYPNPNVDGILTIDDISKLLAIYKTSPDEFIIENDEINNILISAQEAVVDSKTSFEKTEKSTFPLLSLLSALGIAGFLVTNPWGLPLACLALLGGFKGSGNAANDAYIQLESRLGEKATCFILTTYSHKNNVWHFSK